MLSSLLEAKRRRKQERRNDRPWTIVELKLFPPTDRDYPRFDWEEIKKRCGVESDSEDEELEVDEARNPDVELVRRLEEKYGQGSIQHGGDVSKAGRKRKFDVQDVVDKTMGYDHEDDFIDDTAAYDEWVPTDIDTLYGGHYISEGKLEWRRIDSSTIADEDVGSQNDARDPFSKPKPKSAYKRSKESKEKLLKEKPAREAHSKSVKRKHEEGGSKLMQKQASKKLEDDGSVVEVWPNGAKKANGMGETGDGSTENRPALINPKKAKDKTQPRLKPTPKSKPGRLIRLSDRAAPPSMKPGRFFEPPSTRPACTEGGESSKGREPAAPREPANPVQPREPLAPREPSTPREQREPVKAQQPRAPVEPIKPVASRLPQDPKDPRDPRDPRKPKDPKEPVNPKEPRKPAEPKAPIDPK